MSSADEQDNLKIDIPAFVESIGLKRAAPERYSALLVANLLGCALSETQNPAKIVREIELLEQGELGQLKKPIQNRHPPPSRGSGTNTTCRTAYLRWPRMF